jgi:hypothetical protein
MRGQSHHGGVTPTLNFQLANERISDPPLQKFVSRVNCRADSPQLIAIAILMFSGDDSVELMIVWRVDESTYLSHLISHLDGVIIVTISHSLSVITLWRTSISLLKAESVRSPNTASVWTVTLSCFSSAWFSI